MYVCIYENKCIHTPLNTCIEIFFSESLEFPEVNALKPVLKCCFTKSSYKCASLFNHKGDLEKGCFIFK